MLLNNTKVPDPQQKSANWLQNAKAFINKHSKHKIHIIILIVTIIYLVLAPKIYANYFVKYGKPVTINGDLPNTSDDINFSIDEHGPSFVNSENLYQISGWAFLNKEQDQSKYEKYLVLSSDSRTYFFAYDNVKRQDVQIAFQDLGIDVVHSGFTTLISGDCLRSGTYSIGFLFWNMVDNNVIYSVSTQYLVRTPNHVKVIERQETDQNNNLNMLQRLRNYFRDRFGIGINQGFSVPSNRAQQSVIGTCQRFICTNQFADPNDEVILDSVIHQNRFDYFRVQPSTANRYTT